MDTQSGRMYTEFEIKSMGEKLKALEKSIENKPEKIAALKAQLDRIVPVSEQVAEKMRLGNKAYKKRQKKIANASRRRNRK